MYRFVVLMVTACAVETEVGTDVAARRGDDCPDCVYDDCPDWGCGQNSPFVAALAVNDLHEYGTRNRTGFRIMGFRKGTSSYQIDVANGRLYGRHKVLPQLEGAALKGSIITLENAGVWYDVMVAKVTSAPYFVAGATARMEAYELVWAIAGTSQYKNICAHPTYGPDTLGMDAITAVLFEGERIDPGSKTIANVLDPTWFNIGCAGHALAKLALMARVDAARASGFAASTLADKQTLLRSVVADVCGTGQAFTVPQEPLSWKDDRGWLAHWTDARQIEARWTTLGASCLTEPRVLISSSPVEATMFPHGVVHAIRSTCALPPRCSDSDIEHLTGHSFVTANR